MKLLRRDDADALIDGRGAGNDAALDTVRVFLDDMRLEAAARPAPAPRADLAAMFEGRRALPPASERVAAPTPRRPLRNARTRVLAAGLATGVVLFGGLATANALPGPVQRASADLTSHLGIHLPGRAVAHPEPDSLVRPHDTHDSHPAHTGSPSPAVAPSHRATPTTIAAYEPGGPTLPSATSPVVPTLPTTPATRPITTPGSRPVTLPTLPNLGATRPSPTLPSLPLPTLPTKLLTRLPVKLASKLPH